MGAGHREERDEEEAEKDGEVERERKRERARRDDEEREKANHTPHCLEIRERRCRRHSLLSHARTYVRTQGT